MVASSSLARAHPALRLQGSASSNNQAAALQVAALSRRRHSHAFGRHAERLVAAQASTSAGGSEMRASRRVGCGVANPTNRPETAVSEDGLPRSAVLGILGGGQLGRMMAIAAAKLGVEVRVLDPGEPAPAATSATQVVGSFRDPAAILDFARQVDVLTVEIEHIDADAIAQAVQAGVDVHPMPATLKIIQDKLRQKEFMAEHGVPVSPFAPVDTPADLDAVAEAFGFPLMLKSRHFAYDGRGNYVARNLDDLAVGARTLAGGDASEELAPGRLYAERWVPFTKELAVMVARDRKGNIASYPVVETHHEGSILKELTCPADVPEAIRAQAQRVAEHAVSHFEGAGIFGVEMFLLEDGSVSLNEVAPRPHNSGHYTIEACETSQFEQHIRAVLGWPLGGTKMTCGASIMLNLLGEADGRDGMAMAHQTIGQALQVPGVHPQWYGKDDVKTGRKIGHVTITAASPEAAQAKKAKVLGTSPATPATPAATPAPAAAPRPQGTAQVGVIMGSDSDLFVMKEAAKILEDFGIEAEVTLVSAHRTPERMFEYARTAHTRGIQVIIAGAGGAAHLPGMVAACTPLPVIGVPVIPKGAALDGVDSLLSILQMPKGIPVATVAIQNAANAGLLAARIIGAADPAMRDKMQAYQDGLKDMVERKIERMEETGWKTYEK